MIVKQQVRKIIAQSLEVEEDILDEKKLVEIGFNSISFIKIIVDIEEYFNIEFDDNDLNYELFDTEEEIIKYVIDKLTAEEKLNDVK